MRGCTSLAAPRQCSVAGDRRRIDVDIKIVPERDRLFRAIPEIKERLQINIELASPDRLHPGTAEAGRIAAPCIARESRISFHHFELAAQTLSKIERGHAQDLEDVQTMLARNLVTRAGLLEYFDAIEPGSVPLSRDRREDVPGRGRTDRAHGKREIEADGSNGPSPGRRPAPCAWSIRRPRFRSDVIPGGTGASSRSAPPPNAEATDAGGHPARRVRPLPREQRPALLPPRHPRRPREEVHQPARTRSASGC